MFSAWGKRLILQNKLSIVAGTLIMCKSVKTFHRSFVQTRGQSRYSAVEESQVVLF
jgi:hypothetical protein